jgi:hypothetical protein
MNTTSLRSHLSQLGARHRARKVLLAFTVFLVLSLPLIALGDAAPHSLNSPLNSHINSMMAESPVSAYTAGVMAYMLLVGFLVTVLLGGAFAVLNLGLLSKRREDQTGNRDPSDIGILKHPDEQTRSVLPAQEGEIEDLAVTAETRERAAEGVALLTEDRMFSEGENKAA